MVDHLPHIAAHLVRGVAATGAILATETATAAANSDVIAMVERLGLAVALVLFFVYTGWKREQRMGSRIDRLEDEVAQLAAQNAKLAAESTEALKKDSITLAGAIEILSGRTCYAFPNRESYERMLRMLDEYQKRESPVQAKNGEARE